MAWALDAFLSRMPNRRAAKMRADGDECVYALTIADHPYALLFQHTSTDFSDLIILWFPGNKLLQRFIQNPREEKSQRAEGNPPKKSREASPADEIHKAPPRDTPFPYRGIRICGHQTESPFLLPFLGDNILRNNEAKKCAEEQYRR
jgi:hypothetical protein